jgi:hypothetical protein
MNFMAVLAVSPISIERAPLKSTARAKKDDDFSTLGMRDRRRTLARRTPDWRPAIPSLRWTGMKNYDFADRFRAIYDRAVQRYASGQPNGPGFLDDGDAAFLAANGITVQHLYDYAEDHNDGGEPGYDRALAIEMIRRDYFLNAQGGKPTGRTLDANSLPAKTDAIHGIRWLPRIIPKAKAKLRGELPPSLMYSCGGDRAFFKEHDIHPAEFLNLVWRHENNDDAIAKWVVQRTRQG